MSKDLVKKEENVGLIPLPEGIQALDKSEIKELSAGGFLPRVQLMNSGTEKCKSGEFPMNHFALIEDGDNYIDLGSTVLCLPVCFRAMALDTSSEPPIVVYDKDSDEFGRIKSDSNVTNSGCMYGPQFLLWLPVQGCFATLFMGSKSARREAYKVYQYLQKPCVLRDRKIVTAQYTWFIATAVASSSMIDVLPDPQEADRTIRDFMNPKVVVVETASKEEQEATARTR